MLDEAATYLSSEIWTTNDPWLHWDAQAPYDWRTDPTAATLAKDSAMFDTSSPVIHYDTSELGYPFRTSIWTMCQGLLSQVHFTLPLDSNGLPTAMGPPFTPTGVRSGTINLTYTEEWIQSLVSDAYKLSPLFWHHSTRHKPSQSAVCKRPTPRPAGNGSISGVRFLNFSAMTLGGLESDCWCGWWANTTHCHIPPDACDLLLNLAYTTRIDIACNLFGGNFTAGTIDLWKPMRTVMKLSATWTLPCPALNASDHWGAHFNVTALSSLSARIINWGPSGIRVGGIGWQTTTLLLSPMDRVMEPIDEFGNTVSLQCDLAPPQSLVDHFVDELFPAAQGVRQAAPISYCMRFSIELARLHAYQHANLVISASQQSNVVATWRQRCDMKLKQVTACETYRVFNINQTAPNCPFEVPDAYAHSVTPNCLVVYNGDAYDPCLCDPAWCVPPVTSGDHMVNPITGLFNQGSKCKVLHVRDLVTDKLTGLPIWPAASSTTVPRPLVSSPHIVPVRHIHIKEQHKQSLRDRQPPAEPHLQNLAPLTVGPPLDGDQVRQVKQKVDRRDQKQPHGTNG